MSKPLVILIGSASGIGKSTLASELTKKLNIEYLLKTDYIREVVRGVIDSDTAPALHYSSYDAYKCLEDKDKNKELIITGFEEHASYVIPSIERIISKAIDSHDNIIIEGVHLVPGLIDLEKFNEKAKIFFFILSVDEDTHHERFNERAIRLKYDEKQLNYFKENRIINNYLVKVAKEKYIPIIENESLDKTVETIKIIISNNSAELPLYYPIDKIPEIIDIIVRNNNGGIVKIEHNIEGFNEPVIRNIDIYDEERANEYLKKFNMNPNMETYLQNIINLTVTRTTTITANSIEELDKIINELKEKGFLKER